MDARPLALGLLCLAAACGSPATLDCNVRCDAQGGCPNDLICQLGICVPPGQDARRCPGATIGGTGGASGASGASTTSSSSGGSGPGTSSTSGTSSGSSGAGSGTSSGSAGSSGSTGSCSGPFGVDRQTTPSCPVSAPSLGAFANVATGRVPDSASDCYGAGAGACPGTGSDDEYAYPVSTICDDGTNTGPNGIVPFSFDSLTRLSWENEFVSSGDFASASSRCAATNWIGERGQMRLPSATELIGLLDLSSSAAARSGGLTRPGLSFDPNGNWASDDPGTGQRFIVDFTIGEFYPEDPANSSVDGHCVDAADGGPLALTDSCTTLGSPAGEECELLVNGTNPTGLIFFGPTQRQAMTWTEALAYCASLPPCGRYRVPSFKELATLVNFGGTATGTFIDTLSGDVWTSTEAVRLDEAVQPGTPDQYAERIHFQPPSGAQSSGSEGGPALKSAQLYAGCVRGP